MYRDDNGEGERQETVALPPGGPHLPGRQEASLAVQSPVMGEEKDRKELQRQNGLVRLKRPDPRRGRSTPSDRQRQRVASSWPGAVG